VKKLDDLEQRLSSEPDNLALKVQYAGLLREAGRTSDAVELYRTVAIAYRAQGRTQQAIAVCRSILGIAPGDAACTTLLAELEGSAAPRAPARPDSEPLDQTPLPYPVPFHIAEPTVDRGPFGADELDTRKLPRVTTDQVLKLDRLDELTAPGPRDSESELTTPGPRATPVPHAIDSEDDLLTEPRAALPVERASDEELTLPRELPLPDETDPG
jgi:hypothetical protein